MTRNLIVVSGYYGFDNLGDEAILEELIGELSEIAGRDQIVVLSNSPAGTSKNFGVASTNRWRLSEIAPVLRRAKLFISGGGGLFQDTSSASSVIYYAGLLCLAKALGTKTLIYAQGLGPLKRAVSKFCTRMAFNLADGITLRDGQSMEMLKSWGLSGDLTEDPVWLLKPSALPQSVAGQMADLKKEHKKLVALSLRQGGGFTAAHIGELAASLDKSLPADTAVVALPLQKSLDLPALDAFAEAFGALGRRCHKLSFEDLTLPSQWLNLIGTFDLVVGMRLHSLIMALSSGVPVVGIAYDPKVTRVLSQFDQPNLHYTKGESPEATKRQEEWLKVLSQALKESSTYGERASQGASRCKELACQNPLIIAKMLA